MKLFGFQSKTLLSGLLVLMIAGAALWLDLANRGLVWDLLWNLTGETHPPAQILGFSQYMASQTRRQPELALNAEIHNLPENPFGINTTLQNEADPTNRERQMQMIADAGFGWIRQEFAWEDIEIHGRGDFMDRRNAEVGEISAWDKYDHIVDLAEQYDVEIIARLSQAPEWSHPSIPANSVDDAPPDDIQDFVNFAVVVAERYQGRVTNYQLWNEPNLGAEWGYRQIDPARYAEMLCRTYDALKAVDPNIVVHTAALGPTIDLSGRDAYDLLYLQRLYDFGIAECFDVLSAQGYGLFSGPTDRRMRPFSVNFARHQWLRDIMVQNGDAEKPIWISEAGWNPVPNDPNIVGLGTYGIVSDQESAEWIPLAYERTLSEWDYIGTISYWFMKKHDETEKNQSNYYFRLVEPDFTPTVRYEAFRSMIQSGEWRDWRDQEGWNSQARARIPQVLVLGTAVIFAAWVLVRAVVERFSGKLD